MRAERATTPPAMNLFRIFAALIATIPLYGYFVHASRDGQLVGVLIFLTWFFTLVLMASAIAIFLVRRYLNKNTKWAGVFATYFFFMGVIGYGGIQKAFYELLAG